MKFPPNLSQFKAMASESPVLLTDEEISNQVRAEAIENANGSLRALQFQIENLQDEHLKRVATTQYNEQVSEYKALLNTPVKAVF